MICWSVDTHCSPLQYSVATCHRETSDHFVIHSTAHTIRVKLLIQGN